MVLVDSEYGVLVLPDVKVIGKLVSLSSFAVTDVSAVFVVCSENVKNTFDVFISVDSSMDRTVVGDVLREWSTLSSVEFVVIVPEVGLISVDVILLMLTSESVVLSSLIADLVISDIVEEDFSVGTKGVELEIGCTHAVVSKEISKSPSVTNIFSVAALQCPISSSSSAKSSLKS